MIVQRLNDWICARLDLVENQVGNLFFCSILKIDETYSKDVSSNDDKFKLLEMRKGCITI